MRFFVGILMGIAGHQARTITDEMPHGWAQLTNNGIGAVLLGVAMRVFLGDKKEDIKINDVILSFIMGLLSVGTGVALGYMAEEPQSN